MKKWGMDSPVFWMKKRFFQPLKNLWLSLSIEDPNLASAEGVLYQLKDLDASGAFLG